MQIASTILPTFRAPDRILQSLAIIVAIGFPVALVIGWAFEMTVEGMKRTENIPPSEPLPQWSRRHL